VALSEPIDPGVRLAISQWPDDAPRGAVSTFCAEHGISRQSFYKLRERAKADGSAAPTDRGLSDPYAPCASVRDHPFEFESGMATVGR
jgi:hypothetical protein